MPALLVFGIFLITLAISIPIGISMVLGSVAPIFLLDVGGNIPQLLHNTFSGANNTPILAVPLFILGGVIMAEGGISKRLFNFFAYFVGRIPGGVPCAVILTCLFYGAISGSGPATTAAVGSMCIPFMVSLGYERRWSAGLIAVAGGLGVIIPPSIPFVLYSMATGVSTGDLFLGGVLPGILIGLFMMIYAVVYCLRRGEDKEKIRDKMTELKGRGLLRLFLDSFWALLCPVIILAPVLLPAVEALGVDSVHFGVVLVCCLSIGLATPPFGLDLFVAGNLSEEPPHGGGPARGPLYRLLPDRPGPDHLCALVQHLPGEPVREEDRVMKKQLCALLAAGLALSLTSCGISAFDDPDAGIDGPYGHLPRMELVAADTAGKDSAGQLFGELVAEKISEITQGRLTIDYHPNGDLGGDADLLRQVQCGGIDIVVCQTAPVASFVPEMAVFDLPMVFSQYDGDTIDQVLNDPDSEFFIQLSQAYEEKDLHLLGFLQNGTYRITTANRPLYTLEDYHNLQIRTMENSNHMEFWSAIGANPTPLAFSELYFTLSSGGIDAQENAADSCVGINLQEVQDYLACTNHILYANQIAISKESYDALPAEYQQALEQAVSEAIAEIRPQLTQLDEDSKQIMVDSGMELIEYDDSFFQEILALDSVTALYDQINEDVNGLGTILQEALAEAAAEQAE